MVVVVRQLRMGHNFGSLGRFRHIACKSYKASCWTMKSETRSEQEKKARYSIQGLLRGPCSLNGFKLYIRMTLRIAGHHRYIVVWREEAFLLISIVRRHGDEGNTQQ